MKNKLIGVILAAILGLVMVGCGDPTIIWEDGLLGRDYRTLAQRIDEDGGVLFTHTNRNIRFYSTLDGVPGNSRNFYSYSAGLASMSAPDSAVGGRWEIVREENGVGEINIFRVTGDDTTSVAYTIHFTINGPFFEITSVVNGILSPTTGNLPRNTEAGGVVTRRIWTQGPLPDHRPGTILGD